MASFQTITFPTLIAGAYFEGQPFTLYSDEEQTEPLDLSGCIITMSLRPKYNLPVAWTFSNEAGHDGTITITEPTEGKFQIDPVNMEIEPGNYVYDIVVELYTGERKKPVRGTWIFVDQVT